VPAILCHVDDGVTLLTLDFASGGGLQGGTMALYAFDGTWNEEKTGDDPDYKNTNVVRFYRAYHARSGKNDFYVPGVGTRLGEIGRTFGGVFGLGEVPRLKEAYRQLCQNWAAGDTEIDIVGFSRGAAMTLDFCTTSSNTGSRIRTAM
jgi:uncharacterized protein (DUF2235 family)